MCVIDLLGKLTDVIKNFYIKIMTDCGEDHKNI